MRNKFGTDQDRTWAVNWVTPDSLRPNAHNARVHSKQQVRQIAASFEQFGFVNPILIDEQRRIIAGHGRWEAAKLTGLKKVPALLVDGLTDDQIRAYIIADNKIASLAGWSEEILAVELQHLVNLDTFDATVTGFSTTELDLIIEGAQPGNKTDSADEPPPQGPPVTQPGDRWLMGRHALLCGDALDPDCMKILMADVRADLVCVDPPYGVPINGHASGNGRIRHREFLQGAGEQSEPEFIDFLGKVFRLFAQHTEAGALVYTFMSWHHLFELLAAGRDVFQELKQLCCWVKETPGLGSFYRNQHELIAVWKNGRSAHKNNIRMGRHGRNRSNVWRAASVNAFARTTDEGRLSDIHPTVKPCSLLADILLDCTDRGDVVLDSFVGSGSTIIAAERTGRICRAMELDAIYCDAAVRRWQRHTGDVAIHAVTGKPFDKHAQKGRRRG